MDKTGREGAEALLREAWANFEPYVLSDYDDKKNAALVALLDQAWEMFVAYGFKTERKGRNQDIVGSWGLVPPRERNLPLYIKLAPSGVYAHFFEDQHAMIKAEVRFDLAYDPHLDRFFGPKVGTDLDGTPLFRPAVEEVIAEVLRVLSERRESLR